MVLFQLPQLAPAVAHHLVDIRRKRRLDEPTSDSILFSMGAIDPPPAGHHPDRFLRCQEALGRVFARCADAAVEAGWRPEEVAAALAELADDHISH